MVSSEDYNLQRHYHHELKFIHQLAEKFAHSHPVIAKNLHNNIEKNRDPHAEQLISAFALNTARIHNYIDHGIEDICNNLINTLYPNLLMPIPSMTVVQFEAENLQKKILLPPNTLLATNKNYKETCYFSTCYPLTLLPLKVTKASLSNNPSTDHVLRLFLQIEKFALRSLELEKLNFYINAETPLAYEIYELLLQHTEFISLTQSENDASPIQINKSSLKTQGFSPLLPQNNRCLAGLNLLTEFLIFPEKFLFLEINPLTLGNKNFDQQIIINFHLKKFNSKLAEKICAQQFKLNCTPVINLFPQETEPFHLGHKQSEYPIIANASHSQYATEIYRIEEVKGLNREGYSKNFYSLFDIKNDDAKENLDFYFMTHHINANNTIDLTMSFNDTSSTEENNSNWIIFAKALCTNGNLPQQLPFGGDNPCLHFINSTHTSIKKIKCILPFTPVYRPQLRNQLHLPLLKLLTLNQLPYNKNEYITDAFYSILKLCNNDHPSSNILLKGISEIQVHNVHKNFVANGRYICQQGQKIIVHIDENQLSGISVFLLGQVLTNFFALYAPINLFTELVITSKYQGEIHHFCQESGE